MRAADQAHSTEKVFAGPAAGALVKLIIAAVATLALLAVWRPAVIHAQEAKQPPAPSAPPAKPGAKVEPKGEAKAGGRPEPQSEEKAAGKVVATGGTSRTHLVKPGETLWSLAAQYYGDGHAWPQLATANRIPTDGARPPLVVGMTLTVPVSRKVPGTKAGAVAAAPADSSVPKVALRKAGEGTISAPPAPSKPAAKVMAADAKPAVASLAAQTAGKADAAGRGASRPAASTPTAAPSRAIPASAPPTSAPPPAAGAPAPASQAPQPESLALQRRQQTVLTRQGRVRIGLVNADEQAASRKETEVLTVFHRDVPDAAEAERRSRAALRVSAPMPRQGELDAAPFLMSEDAVARSGTITGRVGTPAATLEAYPTRALRSDEIEIQAPSKGSYRVGDVLQSYANFPVVGRGRVVAVPTGIVEVTSVRGDGRAVAVVRSQSGRIEQGQRLGAVPGEPAPRSEARALPTPDVSTTVLWLDPSETIPTLQSYLLIGAGSTKGLRAGDEVALYQATRGGSETMMAVARLVRVGPDHASAVIMRQRGAEIAVGMTARRIARAP